MKPPGHKVAKAAAHYGPGMPESDCGICRFYLGAGRCFVVRGSVAPDCWCEYFDKGEAMPWTAADVDRHKKGLTRSNKARWAKIANGVLKDELAAGTPQSEAEGKAIRIANSKVAAGKPGPGRTPMSRVTR